MTEKPHTRIIVGAAMLAFAIEGWQGTIGEALAHSVGISKSTIGIIVAIVFGWIYSVVYDYANPPKAKTKAKPRRPPKLH